MTNEATEAAGAKAARLAGAMFLFVNATGIFAEVFPIHRKLRLRR